MTHGATPAASWRTHLSARWTHFFFAEEAVYPAVYFRVFLALWTVAFFVPRLPHLRELYTEPATHVPHPWIARLGGFPDLPLFAIWMLVIALLAATIAFAAGFHARTLHPFIILLLAYLHAYDISTVRGYGQLGFYQWLIAYCLPYDRLRDAEGEVLHAPRWGVRLATLLYASVYLFSVCAKTIAGEGWFDGRTLYYTFHGQDYGSFLLSAWFPISREVAKMFGWCTLAAETFIGLGLWHRRSARLAMFTCVAMHTMMALTLRVSILFHLLMIGHLPLFFGTETWERLLPTTWRRRAPAEGSG
jgi:hypothetical protein